jgi:hypothetical protein
MNFDELLRKIGKKYRVEKKSDTRYSVFGDSDVLELNRSKLYDYDEIDAALSKRGRLGSVGRDDLHLRFDSGAPQRLKEEPKGAFVDPKSDIFKPKGTTDPGGSSSEENPFIRVDPIAPRKGDKRGFEPDPNHLKKDGFGPDFKP